MPNQKKKVQLSTRFVKNVSKNTAKASETQDHTPPTRAPTGATNMETDHPNNASTNEDTVNSNEATVSPNAATVIPNVAVVDITEDDEIAITVTEEDIQRVMLQPADELDAILQTFWQNEEFKILLQLNDITTQGSFEVRY